MGTAAKVEQWRRKRRAGFRFTSECSLALVLLAVAVLGLEVINESGAAADLVDYVAAFRWPALAVLFIGLSMSCLALVDSIGFLSARLTGKRR